MIIDEDVGEVFGETSQVYPKAQVGVRVFMIMVNFDKSFLKFVMKL